MWERRLSFELFLYCRYIHNTVRGSTTFQCTVFTVLFPLKKEPTGSLPMQKGGSVSSTLTLCTWCQHSYPRGICRRCQTAWGSDMGFFLAQTRCTANTECPLWTHEHERYRHAAKPFKYISGPPRTSIMTLKYSKSCAAMDSLCIIENYSLFPKISEIPPCATAGRSSVVHISKFENQCYNLTNTLTQDALS